MERNFGNNMLDWYESADGQRAAYKPYRPYFDTENVAESENDEFFESIADIDFSQFNGKNIKKSLSAVKRKVVQKTTGRRIVKAKKGKLRLTKSFPVSKTGATLLATNERSISKVIVPRDKTVVVEGVSKFILSEAPKDDSIKNLGYYNGEKLKQLVLIFNNDSALDFTTELFSPSAQMDYYFSNSQNINDKISVAGDAEIAYTDVVYNLLANPTHIVNAKFLFTGPQVAEQFATSLEVKNKDINGYLKVSPINLGLQVDTMQVQSDQVYFNISEVLGRPYIPDGMDTISYTIKAGMTVVMAFFYRQVSLKKEFFKEAADSRVLL